MASSGALSTSNQYVKYRIDVTPGAKNIDGNYTPVTVSVFFYRTNTGHKTYGSGTVWCRINGTVYSAGIAPSQAITENGIVLFNKTVNIPHNDDGSKRLAVSAWASINSPLTSNEQGFDVVLPTIPRATTPKLNPGSQTMGETITISLIRASSNFTHDVTYQFGNASGTIAIGAGVSASFTVPISLASEIPNNISGTGIITVKTYNVGTLIGTKPVEFTAVVPDTAAPMINSATITDTEAEIVSKFGAFISGKSKLQVVTNAAGVYGSMVQTIKVTYNGHTYTGTTITGIDAVSSAQKIKVTVRDSRGRETSKEYTVTVVPYSAPAIDRFAVTRCDPSGEEDEEEGENLLFEMKFAVSSCNSKNDKSYKIEYKKEEDSVWKTAVSGSVYNYDGTGTKTGNLFDVDFEYQIRLTVTDYFGSTVATAEMLSAFTLVDLYNTGKGIRIGGVANKDGYVMSMDAEFEKQTKFLGPMLVKDSDQLVDALDRILHPYKYIYPVGMILAFNDESDPNILFPGTTWVVTAVGRVLVGQDPDDDDFNVVGKAGGAKTTANLYLSGQNYGGLNGGTTGGEYRGRIWVSPPTYINHDTNATDVPQSVVQPYQVVKYWVRTK